MLHVHLARDVTAVTVQQIQRYQPAPKLDKIQMEWTQLNNVELPVKWLDMETNALTQQVGGLYHKIERYVLHQHEKPSMGRGTQLGYIPVSYTHLTLPTKLEV